MITRFDGRSQIAVGLRSNLFSRRILTLTLELKFQGFSPFITDDDSVASVVASGFQNVPQALGVKEKKQA